MKEIIISIYDSAYNWSILRIEDGKYIQADDEADRAELDNITKLIYDSELLFWRNDDLTRQVVIEKLLELGYNKVIICEDGCVQYYLNGNREV